MIRTMKATCPQCSTAEDIEVFDKRGIVCNQCGTAFEIDAAGTVTPSPLVQVTDMLSFEPARRGPWDARGPRFMCNSRPK